MALLELSAVRIVLGCPFAPLPGDRIGYITILRIFSAFLVHPISGANHTSTKAGDRVKRQLQKSSGNCSMLYCLFQACTGIAFALYNGAAV